MGTLYDKPSHVFTYYHRHILTTNAKKAGIEMMKITSLVALFVFCVAGCTTEGSLENEDSPDSGSIDEAVSTFMSHQESTDLSGSADLGTSGKQKSANKACASDPGSCVTPAAINDSFVVSTTDGCGRADFVDFGPGVPGGADNDDYVEIHDFCADSHGVRAAAALVRNGIIFDLGSKYNGNGRAGSSVIWDPFKAIGNVLAGDTVFLQACLVDGPNDPTPFKCVTGSRTSADG